MAAQPHQDVNVLVTVDDQAHAHFHKAVEALRAAGLKVVGDPLEMVGVVRGTLPRAKINELKKLHGVVDVQEEKDWELAPPGSPS